MTRFHSRLNIIKLVNVMHELLDLSPPPLKKKTLRGEQEILCSSVRKLFLTPALPSLCVGAEFPQVCEKIVCQMFRSPHLTYILYIFLKQQQMGNSPYLPCLNRFQCDFKQQSCNLPMSTPRVQNRAVASLLS